MRRKCTIRALFLTRQSLGFKVMAWGMLAYAALAALHGLAPGIWAHFGEDESHGPFRLLIFTPLLAACLALFVVAVFIPQVIRPLHEAAPRHRVAWPAWSLRGPPSTPTPSRFVRPLV